MRIPTLKPIISETEKIEAPSPVPHLITGFFLLLYSMIFPLYLWWHYIIPLVLCSSLFFVLRIFFKTRLVPAQYAVGEVTPRPDKSRKYARVFLCLIILLAFFYGGMRSVNTYRKTVVEEYKTGLAANVAEIYENAQTLIDIGEKYITDAEELSALKATLTKSQSAQKAGIIDHNLKTLKQDFAPVLEKLRPLILTEEDAAARDMAAKKTEIAYIAVCAHSYNDSAREFNKTLKTFPTKLFVKLTGTSKLAVFD